VAKFLENEAKEYQLICLKLRKLKSPDRPESGGGKSFDEQPVKLRMARKLYGVLLPKCTGACD
jgi:hypothetical protein